MSHFKNSIKTLIIAFDGAQLLDIAGPYQVLASANEEAGRMVYDLCFASLDGEHTKTSSGLTLLSEPLERHDPTDFDMVMVVGGDAPEIIRAAGSPELQQWLKASYPHVDRMCSVCSGTFALAAAGLLGGARVTTHWRSSRILARKYPNIAVDDDAIYLKSGKIWTSAGVTTGIDMCLAMVAEDVSTRAAMSIARRLVLYAHRPGHQAQFSALLEGQSKTTGPLSETLQWMADNRHKAIAVRDCAGHAGMSERTFHRRFVGEAGMTPAKYLESLRIETARGLLEQTRSPLKQVAALAGFSSDQHLILVFEKRLGMSPTDYRKLHGRLQGAA